MFNFFICKHRFESLYFLIISAIYVTLDIWSVFHIISEDLRIFLVLKRCIILRGFKLKKIQWMSFATFCRLNIFNWMNLLQKMYRSLFCLVIWFHSFLRSNVGFKRGDTIRNFFENWECTCLDSSVRYWSSIWRSS